ncbi:Protein CBG18632 [Caenorhabditis briggsae]|uniref:Protein CBG18632 n=1 Tax=Caenorhabditis briggsae TaxID=6238 RepID=A8XTR8_CAEBR|nr:Protein CBG18632 [Caenorhabditis briggsae]CAP36044.2 Protein CBG18632 [Caenorhabditis briggsae]
MISSIYDYVDSNKELENVQNFWSLSDHFNFFLETSTIIFNLIHLSILLQKELRKFSIFILMAGICISDILGFLVSLIFLDLSREDSQKQIQEFRNSNFPFWLCFDGPFKILDPAGVLKTIILNSTRPISIWLAIFMALIRTLSIIFPMNSNFTKPKNTVTLVTVTCLFWIIYYSWELIFAEIWWFPDQISYGCNLKTQARKYTHYVLALSTDFLMESRENREYLVRLIPVFFYPILTVSLLFELYKIKKRRKILSKNQENSSDNTVILVFFMTVSFMLSEGLAGISNFYEVSSFSDRSEIL